MASVKVAAMVRRRVRKKQPSVYERVNVGEDDELTIQGYRSSLVRKVLFWTAVVLSGGTLLLVIALKPTLYTKLTKTKCVLDISEVVLLRVR